MILFAQILLIIVRIRKYMHKYRASQTRPAQCELNIVQLINSMHNPCVQLLTYAQNKDNAVQNYSVCN